MTKTEEAETAQFQLELSPEQAEPIREPIGFGSLDLRLGDCMEVMAGFPDGYFDLAQLEIAIEAPKYNFMHANFKGIADWKSRGIHGLRRLDSKGFRRVSKRAGIALRRGNGYGGFSFQNSSQNHNRTKNCPAKGERIEGLHFQHQASREIGKDPILNQGGRPVCTRLLGYETGRIPDCRQHARNNQHLSGPLTRNSQGRARNNQSWNPKEDGRRGENQEGDGRSHVTESCASVSNAKGGSFTP